MFSFQGQVLSGTIVEPAEKSNHLAGRAIDMNLDTATGWCNSTCLREVDEDPDNSNQAAKCFINKVNEKRHEEIQLLLWEL